MIKLQRMVEFRFVYPEAEMLWVCAGLYWGARVRAHGFSDFWPP